LTDLFRNKYRIASARLHNWNYANEALYFVTICSKNRENYFGEIINGQIHFSELGAIAQSEWFKAIEIRPDMNLQLGEFVMMPNHVHGIIHIGKNEYNSDTRMGTGIVSSSTGIVPLSNDNVPLSTGIVPLSTGIVCRDAMHCVSTNNTQPHSPENEYKNEFAPQSKNLSSIIRGYKSAVTTYARKNNIEFNWQARFHDHIIRSRATYHRISEYIKQNPKNWEQDKLNSERK
jgi:putative transposase